MIVNGERAEYRMTPRNRILEAYKPGDECDFRDPDDGKYHSGYVFLRRENEGDNLVFVFATPDGHEFKYMWWQILAFKNKDTFRLTWSDDDILGPPPADYERPVNS